jgi:hypothetical protein
MGNGERIEPASYCEEISNAQFMDRKTDRLG